MTKKWLENSTHTCFSYVFNVEDVDDIPTRSSYLPRRWKHFDKHQLQQGRGEVEELKPDKAAGSDDFLPKVLQAVTNEVVMHFCRIFNRSLTITNLPFDFRSMDVCHTPKKGFLMETCNNRPISLTSVPGKVFKSIAKDRGGQLFLGDTQPHQHKLIYIYTLFSCGKVLCYKPLLLFLLLPSCV